jgi:hypothetical protein
MTATRDYSIEWDRRGSELLRGRFNKLVESKPLDIDHRMLLRSKNAHMRRLMLDASNGTLRQLAARSIDTLRYSEIQLQEAQEYRTWCPSNFSPKWAHGCTLRDAACFDITRCAGGLTVYVYPDEADATATRQSPLYIEILATIRRSRFIVHDPAKACVLVPAFDTACFCETCIPAAAGRTADNRSPRQDAATLPIEQALQRLATWDGGRNHLVFDYCEAPCIPYHIGLAIGVKTGLSDFHHRPGFDLSIPLFGMMPFERSDRLVPPHERARQLVFKGTRSQDMFALRKTMLRLHNGVDFVLVSACRDCGTSRPCPQQCVDEEREFRRFDYAELLRTSQFGLVLEGFGYDSFRLIEVLAAGSIPVVLNDHYVLPFDDLVPWLEVAIVVPEEHLLRLPLLLAQVTEPERAAMQRKGRFVYETILASLSTHVDSALTNLDVRLRRESGYASGKHGAFDLASPSRWLQSAMDAARQPAEPALATDEAVLAASFKCNIVSRVISVEELERKNLKARSA